MFLGTQNLGSHVWRYHKAQWEEAYRRAQPSKFHKRRGMWRRSMTKPHLKAEVEQTIKEVLAAREIERASAAGFRSIPAEAVTDADRATIRAWLGAVTNNPTARKRIFIEAVSRVKDKHQNKETYAANLRAIQSLIDEASVTQAPTVLTKKIGFDPRMSLEIAKLAYALDVGWSFVVHILCVYGLQQMAKGLRSEGLDLATELPHVPRPGVLIKAEKRRLTRIARETLRELDPLAASYGYPDEDETEEDILNEDILDDDLGETQSDADTRHEVEEVAFDDEDEG